MRRNEQQWNIPCIDRSHRLIEKERECVCVCECVREREESEREREREKKRRNESCFDVTQRLMRMKYRKTERKKAKDLLIKRERKSYKVIEHTL